MKFTKRTIAEVTVMKKIVAVFVAISVVSVGLVLGLAKTEAAKNLPTGSGFSVSCLDYGIEMRDAKRVKSCLLAQNTEFQAVGGQRIACLAKYAIAFTPEGKVEYCSLSKDMELRRTTTEGLTAMATGRVAFYPQGTLEVARLKDSAQLPFKPKSSVVCRGSAPVSFRPDGYVATCILDQESLFVGDKKKKTASVCQAGGLITFDNDGIFSDCYPPPPKLAVPDKTTVDKMPADKNTPQQGGQNR
jgi:hypothetical protein